MGVPEIFLLERLESNYAFVRELELGTRTGTVIHDTVVLRRTPILARPGEWIVSPYRTNGRWMGREAYRHLLESLAQRWSLDTVSNADAAILQGPIRPK